MRDQGIAGDASASGPRRSVSGLGVCDAWRLELSAEQWPWLLDELEEVRGPLEEALQRARERKAVEGSEAAADEAAALEYELRLVRRMRAQLPAIDHGEAVAFVGPAELVRELVRDVLQNVVDALSHRLRDVDPTDPERRARLVCTAAAAAAWTRTFVECSELEGFSFDPAADPCRSGRGEGGDAVRLEQREVA